MLEKGTNYIQFSCSTNELLTLHFGLGNKTGNKAVTAQNSKLKTSFYAHFSLLLSILDPFCCIFDQTSRVKMCLWGKNFQSLHISVNFRPILIKIAFQIKKFFKIHIKSQFSTPYSIWSISKVKMCFKILFQTIFHTTESRTRKLCNWHGSKCKSNWFGHSTLRIVIDFSPRLAYAYRREAKKGLGHIQFSSWKAKNGVILIRF